MFAFRRKTGEGFYLWNKGYSPVRAVFSNMVFGSSEYAILEFKYQEKNRLLRINKLGIEIPQIEGLPNIAHLSVPEYKIIDVKDKIYVAKFDFRLISSAGVCPDHILKQIGKIDNALLNSLTGRTEVTEEMLLRLREHRVDLQAEKRANSMEFLNLEIK